MEEKGLGPADIEEPGFGKPSVLVCKSNLNRSEVRNTLLVLCDNKPWARDECLRRWAKQIKTIF